MEIVSSYEAEMLALMTARQANERRPKGERSVGIDALRIFAMLAVAAGHLWGDTPELRQLLYAWHVPVFFFLSGYLWTGGRPFGAELKSRLKSLLIPFLVWTTAVCLLVMLPLIAFGLTSPDQLSTALWGGASARGVIAPFWFVPVLFAATLLLRSLERWNVPRIAIAGVAAGALAACYVWGSALALYVPHDLFFALPILLYLLAGIGVRQMAWGPSVKLVTALVIIIAAVPLLISGSVAPLDIKLGDFGTPVASVALSVLICVALVWIFEACFARLSSLSFSRTLNLLARSLLVVLFSHTTVYLILTNLGAPYVLVFLVAMALCFGAGLLVIHSPFATLLAGTSRAHGAKHF